MIISEVSWTRNYGVMIESSIGTAESHPREFKVTPLSLKTAEDAGVARSSKPVKPGSDIDKRCNSILVNKRGNFPPSD